MTKAVILAGGFGTRISEVSHLVPKPMIEIGYRPILWHIMKMYSTHNINDFVVCCGYRGYIIKEYFANYFLHNSDVTFDMANNKMTVHRKNAEEWNVTLVDTGENTMTGGRIRRVRDYLDGTFCMTYGDGVSDVDITALMKFHKEQGRKGTITAVQPAGRFGALKIEGDVVTNFHEKPSGDGNWVSGGFMVFEPSFIDMIEGDETVLEQEPLSNLADQGQLSVRKHTGFWHAMDTLRDRNHLEALWEQGNAPWKTW